MCVSGEGIASFLGFEYCSVITLASRVFRLLLPILPSCLRFLSSELGLRWPSCWAPPPRYHCHRFGALFRWGNRFLSWIRVRSCDYSRVTRVRVLHTFLTTSLRYLRILALLGSQGVVTPPFWPALTFFSRAVPLLGF